MQISHVTTDIQTQYVYNTCKVMFVEKFYFST